jgi:uncharacterized membrane protein YhaH (DUF805 family)
MIDRMLIPHRLNPFSLQGRVSRHEYLVTGVVLMLVKYAVEFGVILAATGLVYTPLDFFNPLLSGREQFAEAGADWLGMAWLVWTIPFVWIAVAMTFRRAVDADWTPWTALLMLVPLVNFGTMLAMAWAPSADETQSGDEQEDAAEQEYREAWASPQADLTPPALRDGPRNTSGVVAALAGLAVGVAYTLLVMLLSVYGFGSYGAALFFGAPIVTGAAAAYVFNRRIDRGVGASLLLAMALAFWCCCAFLLIGLEGAVCLVMALPIMLPLSMFGAVLGWAIAASYRHSPRQDDRGMLGCLLVLPLLAGVEPLVTEPAKLMVETQIEIAAPPEVVWETVVAFPEIDTRPEWFFRWGIAAPIRARIEGQGVGAVRHCEFTTGAFVEPITVWDCPCRLAFDVTDQPEPMFELTPYRNLHPPHLTGSFRSTRGEFELIPLDGGGTRLIGRTWYELDMAPHGYWRHWTDQIVHQIHLRVLRHIRRVAEG